MKITVLLVALALALAAWPAEALAQGRSGRFELGVGVGLLGGAALGDNDAELRARSGTNVVLFGADADLSRAREIDVRGGIALTRRYSIEVRAGLSHPELRATISSDIEGFPDTTLVERLDQYVIDASFLARFDGLRIGPVVPFVAAGAGYLRQLHEGLMLIEQGTAYHAGGGGRHDLFSRASGMVKGGGVRGDVRVYFFSGGVAVRDRPAPHVAASGSFFVRF